MRQYNIIFEILLILPFFDFTLAAPIPAQGRCQTCIDPVHIPRDVIPVLKERGGDDELEKVVQQFEKWTIEDPHASSSSAPSGPEHGSMNHGQQPAQSTPTANPDPFVEPSSPSSTASSTDSSTLTASGSDAEFWNPLLNTGDPGYQGDIVLPADLGLPLQEDMAADGHHVDDVQQPNPGQSPQENGVLDGHHVDNDLQQPNPGQWLQENGVANVHRVGPSSLPFLLYSPTPSYYEHFHQLASANPNAALGGGYWRNLDEHFHFWVDDDMRNVRLLSPQESAGVLNGYHADDLQQPNPGQWLQENGVSNGHHVDDVQQPNPGQWPQENSVANGHRVNHVQQPDPLVEPPSPSSATYSLTSSDYNYYRQLASADPNTGFDGDFWRNPDEPWNFRVYENTRNIRPLSPQVSGVANGHQVDDVQPPNPRPSPQENSVSNGYHVDDLQQPNALVEPSSLYSPTSSDYGHYHQLTSADPNSVPEGDYWGNLDEPGHYRVDDNIRLLSPQEGGVANGHQVHNVQLPNPGLLPQENGLANGHQVNDVQLPGTRLSPQDDVMANGDPVDWSHWFK